MTYLILALAALAAGPALSGALRQGSRLATTVDGFVVTAIPLLVFFQFVPGAVEQRDLVVLIGLAAGMTVPVVLERGARAKVASVDDGALRARIWLA